MRFVIELSYTDGGVEGQITADESPEPLGFSSWLELIRLLEAPDATQDGRSAGPTGDDVR